MACYNELFTPKSALVLKYSNWTTYKKLFGELEKHTLLVLLASNTRLRSILHALWQVTLDLHVRKCF